MQSFRSGGHSGSAVSDLKSLMEMASNPGQLKSALQQLDDRISKAESAEKAMRAEEMKFFKLKEEYDFKVKSLEALSKTSDEKSKALGAKEAALSGSTVTLAAREKELDKKSSGFEAMMAEKLAALKAKEHALEQKFKDAASAMTEALALKKKYSDKEAKLKEALG